MPEVMNKDVASVKTWGDYATVYARQTLLAIADTRPAPTCWWDFLERFQDQQPLIREAMNAAGEFFGKYPCEDGTRLFGVEKLTLKESAITARMDLTHAEKIERTKPLREKRHADAEARKARPYRPSKYEREYQEIQRLRETEQEERIAAAVTEVMVVSDDDRSWAHSFGLSLP